MRNQWIPKKVPRYLPKCISDVGLPYSPGTPAYLYLCICIPNIIQIIFYF